MSVAEKNKEHYLSYKVVHVYLEYAMFKKILCRAHDTTLIFNCNLFSYTCMNGLSYWLIIKYHCITMRLYIEKIFIISLIIFPLIIGAGSSYKIDNIQNI